MKTIQNTRHHHGILFPGLLVICILSLGITGILAEDGWQQVPSPAWVRAEIPPGWTIYDKLVMGEENRTATFSARSPDWESELIYALDHSEKGMTMDEMQSYQDQRMAGIGYRICRTKDPVKRTKADCTSLKQVYVQGSDKGAVMYSASYPDWGQVHVTLLMTGTGAVSQYYESLPPRIPDHLLPVKVEKEEQIDKKEEIGTISFSPGTTL
ncbi:MAG: hypothetical protein LUQ07_03525 [Methanospirillum sp.]|nr:hypothetical protein [Methanospirillum sp.]